MQSAFSCGLHTLPKTIGAARTDQEGGSTGTGTTRCGTYVTPECDTALGVHWHGSSLRLGLLPAT